MEAVIYLCSGTRRRATHAAIGDAVGGDAVAQLAADGGEVAQVGHEQQLLLQVLRKGVAIRGVQAARGAGRGWNARTTLSS